MPSLSRASGRLYAVRARTARTVSVVSERTARQMFVHRHALAAAYGLAIYLTVPVHAEVFYDQAARFATIVTRSVLVLAPAFIMIGFIGMTTGGHESHSKFVRMLIGATGVFCIAAVVELVRP